MTTCPLPPIQMTKKISAIRWTLIGPTVGASLGAVVGAILGARIGGSLGGICTAAAVASIWSLVGFTLAARGRDGIEAVLWAVIGGILWVTIGAGAHFILHGTSGPGSTDESLHTTVLLVFVAGSSVAVAGAVAAASIRAGIRTTRRRWPRSGRRRPTVRKGCRRG